MIISGIWVQQGFENQEAQSQAWLLNDLGKVDAEIS